MAQSIITAAFESYKAQQEALKQPVVLDEFVLAMVPGQDDDTPIDPSEGLPAAEHIVYAAPVTQDGYVTPNSVAYSLIMDTRVGDFEFNWVGLRNKASGTIAAITHTPIIQKYKSITGAQNGNSVTRSILMSYQHAQEITGITVDASTWQIDFTARLFGMDENERLVNLDVFGDNAFLSDGFKVVRVNSTYTATNGRGYVGGLRCHLDEDRVISGVVANRAIYLDASWQGQLTSQWNTIFELKVSAEALNDYEDEHGYQHYVTKVADIDAAGHVIDRRYLEGFAQYYQQSRVDSLLDNKVDKSSITDSTDSTSSELVGSAKSVNFVKLLAAGKWTKVAASLTVEGVTMLSNLYNGTSQTKATTEKALTDGLKTKSNAVHKHSASDINAGTLAKERLPNASTIAKGASQLNDTVTSTSKTQSLTANMGRYIWAKAVEARDLAASKMTQATADGRYLMLDGSKGAPVAARYLSGEQGTVGTKIRLPYKTNHGKMLVFTVRVYQSYQAFDIQISGYLYASTNQWYSPKVVMMAGTTDITVVLGRDDDGYAYVWLPSGGYKGIAVLDVVGGYSGGDWNTGWVIFETNNCPNVALSKTIYPPFSPNNPNISDSVSTVSSTIYASLTAVKSAYDKAVEARDSAASKMTQTTADGRYLGKTAKAADSSQMDGKTYSQLYTAIRQGLSPNTWRSISDAVNSSSSDISASLKAVKTAYDKGVSAYNLAANKMTQATADGCYLGKTAKAADSSKMDGKTYSQLYTAIRVGLSPNTWRSISDVVNSTSSDISASLKAVKTAYDKAVEARDLAASKMTQASADGRYLMLDGSKGAPVAARFLLGGLGTSGTKIRLPYKTKHGKMLVFTVRVYQSYQAFDIQISGYLYASTNQWYSPKVVMMAGTTEIRVVLGRDDDGYAYVWLPSGDYKGIAVLDVVGGYSSGNWNNNWTITEDDNCPNVALSKTVYPPYSLNNPPPDTSKQWVKVKSGTCSYAVANSGSGYFRGTLNTGLTAPGREFDSGRYRIKFFTDGIISKPSSTPSSSVSWGFYGIIKNITRWNGPHTVCADVYGYGTGLAGGVTNRWELWELQ